MIRLDLSLRVVSWWMSMVSMCKQAGTRPINKCLPPKDAILAGVVRERPPSQSRWWRHAGRGPENSRCFHLFSLRPWKCNFEAFNCGPIQTVGLFQLLLSLHRALRRGKKKDTWWAPRPRYLIKKRRLRKQTHVNNQLPLQQRRMFAQSNNPK